jgi:RNA polymerase sigma factor (sigma-70 family)
MSVDRVLWKQLETLRAEAFGLVNDRDLLRRFLDKADDDAFEELVRRHGGMVWAVCRQMLPSPSDAEDAFQAVFLAFIKSAGRIRDGNVGAWLHGTAVRCALKLRRGAVRQKQRDTKIARPEADSPLAERQWDEMLSAVHEEVERLPPSLRTVFVLCELEGMPQTEAGLRLGWKPGTLTGRLSQARKRLLEALAKRGLAPAAATGLLALGMASTSAEVPLRLLAQVMNFPRAAGEALPVGLLLLAQEIVPMTLSKLKLLTLGLMATVGLSAGTGWVMFPSAGGQSPEVVKEVDALLKAQRPAAKPVPVVDVADLGKVATLQPLAVETLTVGNIEYMFIEMPSGDVLTLSDFILALKGLGSKGWEFAGSVQLRSDSEMWAKAFDKKPASSGDRTSLKNLWVYKRTKADAPKINLPMPTAVTPASPTLPPPTIMPSVTLAPPRSADSQPATKAVTQKLHALKAADVTAVVTALEKILSSRYPGSKPDESSILFTIQPQTNSFTVEATEAQHREIIELLRVLEGTNPPATPTVTSPRPVEPKRNPTSRPPSSELPSAVMIPPTDEKPDYPPVVIQLKHLDPQTAAKLATQCLDVVPKTQERSGFNPNRVTDIPDQIQIVQHTNSIVLFKTKPAEVARIEKLLKALDVPAKNAPRMSSEYVPAQPPIIYDPRDERVPLNPNREAPYPVRGDNDRIPDDARIPSPSLPVPVPSEAPKPTKKAPKSKGIPPAPPTTGSY